MSVHPPYKIKSRKIITYIFKLFLLCLLCPDIGALLWQRNSYTFLYMNFKRRSGDGKL